MPAARACVNHAVISGNMLSSVQRLEINLEFTLCRLIGVLYVKVSPTLDNKRTTNLPMLANVERHNEI